MQNSPDRKNYRGSLAKRWISVQYTSKLRAGEHFDISISISITINISIRKVCVNRGYISISINISIRVA